MTEIPAALARAVGDRLNDAADDKTREWWERYLKGTVPFRGVPMRSIRAVVHDVWRDLGLGELPPAQQVCLALGLFREPYSEDKLAGVLALAELLLAHLGLEDVDRLGSPLAEGHIADWGTCDWYCVKVLGPFVEKGPDRRERAEALASWRRAETLWQRRAAAVSLVNLAPKGESVFPGFSQMSIRVCEANAESPERFLQTSVGWLLRELSRADPQIVRTFVEGHKEQLSREAYRMATAKIDPARKGRRR